MPESQPGAPAQETSRNYCYYEGFLVNGDFRLPTDPIDHDDAGLPILGCNRLRCPSCNAMVRSANNLSFKNDLVRVSTAELYALSDLSTSPLLTARRGTRLYLCRCTSWAQSIGKNALGDPDPDPFVDPVLPWRCDGHPIAELPCTLDGIEVTPANVGEITAQSLRGITPPGAAPDDKFDGNWAGRLHARLAKTPWQQAVVDAALACMTDSDFEPRTRALHFFLCRDLPAGAQRAVELLDGDRSLFADVPDLATRTSRSSQGKDRTLEHTLWLVAAPLIARPGHARDLARKEALTSGKANYPLYSVLAEGDPEWVAAHVDELARANPAGVKLLADAVRHRFPERVPQKPVLDRLSGPI